MMMITISSLQTFVGVIEAGGFIAAQETLHRSQPSITHAIKKLEAELQFELFDRSYYRPRLTPKGKAFYKRAQWLLQQVIAFEKEVEELRDGNSDGTLD